MKESKLMFYWISEGTGCVRTKQDLTLSQFLEKADDNRKTTGTSYSEMFEQETTSPALMIGDEIMHRAVFSNGLILEYAGDSENRINRPSFYVDADITNLDFVQRVDKEFKDKGK